MVKTSKGVILSQASQIKSDYSFALIKATADNKSLVQDASSAELKVNALVEYSKDSQWDPKKLTSLGFPAGCFLIVDLRGQDIHAADLITNLALVRQYGYQAGVIDDLSTLDDIKALKANQIYLINSGKTNDDQDASLNGNEITDGSGKLAVGMSVKWQRDYTNVDVSGDHAGFVGMGQDTLLKGGNAFGYSTNGRDFNAVITPKGLIFRRPDAERMWRLLKPNEIADINSTVGDKVKKEVDSATAEIPAAVSAANSAVSAAESAIAASKVNSDAIVAQSEAISEAKSAMDSATAEIQQTAANAASDAAKIRADVARVQNEVDTAKAANSASVEALKSDINTAKQDLADVHDSLDKAQSAIEQNQKLINDSVAKITSDVSATKQDLATVHDSLTKARAAAEQNQKAINDSIAEINANVDATNQDLADVRQGLTKAQSDIIANQKAVNDNVAQINSDIEQDRKDIASAQQANADTAKQLDTYSKQATEQGKTIKTIQDKQDGFTATLADVQGNVSQVSDKVDGLSASLKDTQGNVASVKAQADQLSATLTDHGKAIATLTASAKELSSTLEDADGRLSKVEQTAQTNSSTLSDVQGDLSQVKQNATKLVSTLKDAQGNISTLQQKADSLSTQLVSAQGDIATLQTGIDGVKATLTSHDKSIHTLQLDSKSLKDSMVNAQGDISTLRKTATDVTSELEDHTGRLSKVEQSAAKQATTLSDLQGNLSQIEQKADSNTATISSINKNAMQDRGVITDTKTSFDSLTQLGTYSIKASGLPKMPEQHYGTLVVSGSAGSGWLSQQFVADTTGNVYTRVFSNNAWSAWKQGGSQDAINQVKQTADSNSATIRNVQGDVSTLKQTATGIKSSLASHEGDIHTLQLDSKSLKDSMVNAQGDISALNKTATSLDSEMKDHAGRLSKVEQSAATQATTLSDLQGNLSQVKQQADGLVTTLKDAQGDITQIQQKADGTLAQLKSAQGDIASLQTDVTGIKATLTSHEGDIHTLQADSKTLKDDMADAKGNISSLQKTSTSLVSEFRDHDGRLSKVEQTATEHTSELADAKGNLDKVTQKADSLEATLTDAQKDINSIKVDASGIHEALTGQGKQITTINATLDGLNTKYEGVSDDLSKLSGTVATNSTQIDQNKKSIALKADQATVDNLSGEVSRNTAQLKVQADQISSKVSSEDFKTLDNKVGGAIAQIQKNSTAIDENSKLISLKANQTDVDNIKGTAQQLSARLDVMAGEVKSKVDETKVNNIVDGKGYATTSTVQSLVDQKAGTINESITNLTNEVNTRNGVNLLKGTKDFSGSWHNYGSTNYWHTENLIDPNGNHSVKSDSLSWYGYYQPIYLDTGDYTFSGYYYSEGGKPVYFYVKPNSGDNLVEASYTSNLDSTPNGWRWFVVHFKVTKAGNAAVRLESGQDQVLHIASYKLERGTVANPVWTPAPSDNATVTQVQQITASIDGLQSRVTNYQNDTSSKYTQLSSLMQSKVNQGDLSSVRTQLANAINDRVGKGELMSQINLQAGNTLIQTGKLYLDSSSVVFSGRAFIPSAAIASLSADKINTGWLNTNNVSLGDGRTRIRADHDYMYIQPTGSAASNTGIRMGYSGLDFLTNVIPNGYSSSVPYYSIGYDGAANGYFKISAFDHINPGGATATQNWFSMVDAISLTNSEINFATKGNMHMQVFNGGVNIKPTLFFQNNTNNGTWAGFTRGDNSDIVEFSTGDNNGENFRIDCGARFMQYVYINGNARAQQWLTNSTLSKKTNIRKLDQQIALDKIRQDDQYLYEYKRNVAQGIYDPQASFIIDDVNDVSHYSVPREFIDQSGNYREPNVELAYLIAAFQAIDKQVQKQKEEIKELKEKLQHE